MQPGVLYLYFYFSVPVFVYIFFNLHKKSQQRAEWFDMARLAPDLLWRTELSVRDLCTAGWSLTLTRTRSDVAQQKLHRLKSATIEGKTAVTLELRSAHSEFPCQDTSAEKHVSQTNKTAASQKVSRVSASTQDDATPQNGIKVSQFNCVALGDWASSNRDRSFSLFSRDEPAIANVLWPTLVRWGRLIRLTERALTRRPDRWRTALQSGCCGDQRVYRPEVPRSMAAKTGGVRQTLTACRSPPRQMDGWLKTWCSSEQKLHVPFNKAEVGGDVLCLWLSIKVLALDFGFQHSLATLFLPE